MCFLGNKSELYLPKNTCSTNLIEYTNVNILPTIAKIGKIIPRVFKLNRGACVASIIASKNFSFDKKPLNGGTPAILNAVITVRVKEIGMIVSKPPSFYITCACHMINGTCNHK